MYSHLLLLAYAFVQTRSFVITKVLKYAIATGDILASCRCSYIVLHWLVSTVYTIYIYMSNVKCLRLTCTAFAAEHFRGIRILAKAIKQRK